MGKKTKARKVVHSNIMYPLAMILISGIFIYYLCNASAILTPIRLFNRMFIDSCKRLKIMKGSDAIGLGLSLMISPTTICTDWADNNHLIWSKMSY